MEPEVKKVRAKEPDNNNLKFQLILNQRQFEGKLQYLIVFSTNRSKFTTWVDSTEDNKYQKEIEWFKFLREQKRRKKGLSQIDWSKIFGRNALCDKVQMFCSKQPFESSFDDSKEAQWQNLKTVEKKKKYRNEPSFHEQQKNKSLSKTSKNQRIDCELFRRKRGRPPNKNKNEQISESEHQVADIFNDLKFVSKKDLQVSSIESQVSYTPMPFSINIQLSQFTQSMEIQIENRQQNRQSSVQSVEEPEHEEIQSSSERIYSSSSFQRPSNGQRLSNILWPLLPFSTPPKHRIGPKYFDSSEKKNSSSSQNMDSKVPSIVSDSIPSKKSRKNREQKPHSGQFHSRIPSEYQKGGILVEEKRENKLIEEEEPEKMQIEEEEKISQKQHEKTLRKQAHPNIHSQNSQRPSKYNFLSQNSSYPSKFYKNNEEHSVINWNFDDEQTIKPVKSTNNKEKIYYQPSSSQSKQSLIQQSGHMQSSQPHLLQFYLMGRKRLDKRKNTTEEPRFTQVMTRSRQGGAEIVEVVEIEDSDIQKPQFQDLESGDKEIEKPLEIVGQESDSKALEEKKDEKEEKEEKAEDDPQDVKGDHSEELPKPTEEQQPSKDDEKQKEEKLDKGSKEEKKEKQAKVKRVTFSQLDHPPRNEENPPEEQNPPNAINTEEKPEPQPNSADIMKPEDRPSPLLLYHPEDEDEVEQISEDLFQEGASELSFEQKNKKIKKGLVRRIRRFDEERQARSLRSRPSYKHEPVRDTYEGRRRRVDQGLMTWSELTDRGRIPLVKILDEFELDDASWVHVLMWDDEEQFVEKFILSKHLKEFYVECRDDDLLYNLRHIKKIEVDLS